MPAHLSNYVVKNGNNVEVTSPSDSVSSMASLVTLTSPTTSHEMVASPTTASASPMSEEVVSVAIPVTQVQREPEAVLASLSVKSGQVISWLDGLVREGERGGVRVLDTEAVGRELDRYRALLQQLEGRKFQMEEIVATATDLHPGSEEVVNT